MTDKNTYYAGGLGVDAYDLLLNEEVVAGDIAFYLDCAKRFGEPVLEIATGTGRVLVPLAQGGYDVTGLDLSTAMLRRAEHRLREQGLSDPRVKFVQGDMRRFDLGRQYALILVPFRSFQHLTEPAEQRAALGCMYRHLKPGGHLVLNLFDPRFDKLVDPNAMVGSTREGRDSTGRLVRRTVIARDVDFLRQVVRDHMRIEVCEVNGFVAASEESEWALRWMQRQETAYLLELSGFEVVAEYSDFDRSPPAYGKEQIWIARRRDI